MGWKHISKRLIFLRKGKFHQNSILSAKYIWTDLIFKRRRDLNKVFHSNILCLTLEPYLCIVQLNICTQVSSQSISVINNLENSPPPPNKEGLKLVNKSAKSFSLPRFFLFNPQLMWIIFVNVRNHFIDYWIIFYRKWNMAIIICSGTTGL